MHFTDELDATATLADLERVVHERRATEVEDLLLVAHWADLHASDPQQVPDVVPAWAGGDQLVELGGDGTPLVQELCIQELAIARHVHPLAARSAMADVLDLRHRLTLTYAVLLGPGCETWVARKVAAMTRHLDRNAAHLVDAAVAAAIATESPGRVIKLAEAKIIEADTAAHQAKLETERRRRYVGLGQTDEHGLRNLFARLEAGDAAWLDASIDRIADLLAQRRDLVPDLPADCTKDELRAEALTWLARPEDVLALLNHQQPDGPPRQAATLYVHLHQATLDGTATGVARVEDHGPALLNQLTRLLGHTHVTLAPVIDLNTTTSVNSYEHPEAVKHRTHLRTLGEAFPHTVNQSRRTDTDHPTPFDPHGPPGQTGDLNATRLTRTNHRAKTHKPYMVRQTNLGEYLWRTPHGLHRLIDAYGTHDLDPAQALAHEHPGALDAALDRLRAKLDRGELS